jgi:hypothetical protein
MSAQDHVTAKSFDFLLWVNNADLKYGGDKKIMMILIVLLPRVVPFFIKGLDGRPLMTLEDWKMDMPELPMDLLTEAAQESVPMTPEVTEGYR